eukprot:TRINITY_DN431_c10_g1_i1.p1 TRINITY_DN431_c10_g1~~TRINITY_DN431_c10_g1_i1.p1  ORF type:complete len:257 (+),score=45.69 TRINITY_DN431_c10_g1_i1:50-772(+)
MATDINKKELEEEVKRNVKNMRDEGMKEIYKTRMEKLKNEIANKLLVFRDGIYPEFTPQQFIEIAWGGGDTEDVALNGNRLILDKIQTKPVYMFETGDNIKYCLIAFDADAKTLLWARFNIEGETKYSTGRDWFRWQPPHPANDNSPHRIIFMLFHQKENVDLTKLKTISKFSSEGRSNFCPKRFAALFNFQIVVGLNGIVTIYTPVSDSFRKSLKPTVAMDENKDKPDTLPEGWYPKEN